MRCLNNHGEMELQQVQETVHFRDVDVTFWAEHFVCPECGLEEDNSAMAAANQRALSDAYRKHVGLLSGEEIVTARKRKGWTQEQLAQTMKVGIASVKRWEGGLIQNRAMDEALRRALFSEGCQCGGDLHQGNREFSLERFKLVLKAFNKKLGRDLQASSERLLKPAKYLWYADMVAFRELGQSMTGARYAALPYGPQLDNYRDYIELLGEIDESQAEPLTDQEERIISRIVATLQNEQAAYDASHREPAWKNVFEGRGPGKPILYSSAELIQAI